jgi:hypothetical protein
MFNAVALPGDRVASEPRDMLQSTPEQAGAGRLSGAHGDYAAVTDAIR